MGEMSGIRLFPEKEEGREGKEYFWLVSSSFGCFEQELSSRTSLCLFLELDFSVLISKPGLENISKLDRSGCLLLACLCSLLDGRLSSF